MAIFKIIIKTPKGEERKTINASSLTAAKAQATVAFKSFNADQARIFVANEDGVKLAQKMIEDGRGKWEDVTSGELVEKEYTVAFTIEETGEQCSVVVKAEDLQGAKYEASCLRDKSHGAWSNDATIFSSDGEKLAELRYVFGHGFLFLACDPQSAPQQAAQEFKLVYRPYGENRIALATIEANNLDDAKGKAEVLQAANFWQNEISIYGKGKELLARREMIGDALAWSNYQIAQQELAQELAKEKQEFTIRFSDNGSSYNFMTIEAANLHEATEMAESMQGVYGWCNDMAMFVGFNSTLLSVYDYDSDCGWCWREVMKPAKKQAQKSGFAIVNEIPDQGRATLSNALGIESIHTLLIGQDPERLIVLDGDIASKVEVSKEAGCSIVHTISDEICDDSYLISSFAAIQVLRWWTSEEAQSVGFVQTKNNHLIIVTESEARWLDEKFFPLTKTGRR